MHKRKGKLESRLGQMRNHVHFLNIRVDSKKQQLQDSETNQNLEALEHKMKQFEQNLFHMQNFIVTKSAETDFSESKGSVLENLEKVNKILMSNVIGMQKGMGF